MWGGCIPHVLAAKQGYAPYCVLTGDCHNDVISVDDVLKLIAEVKQHNKTRDAESAAAGSKHSSSACLHEGSAAAAMESHSDNFPHKQQAINPLCHGGHDDCSEHHHAAGDVHQRDHQQCGPCPQHLQALAQPPQAAKHSQQQQQQQQSHERQALLPQPSAQAAGQQQSPQLEQLKPSQQPRQQLLSEWWRQDPDISRLVIDMLQAETNDPSSSHHTSSTLKLYDTLLHAGQAACTGHQEIQTSGSQMHRLMFASAIKPSAEGCLLQCEQILPCQSLASKILQQYLLGLAVYCVLKLQEAD